MATRRASPTALLLAVTICTAATVAAARTPLVDDPPWHLLDTGRSVSLAASAGIDEASDWSISRTGITTPLPSGADTRAYARWSFVVIDRAASPAAVRWPDIVGPDADPVDVAEWNNDVNAAGWDRPEVGLLARTRWPLVGDLDYAVSAWMPFADNGLYPLAVRGISLRAALRKCVGLGWATAELRAARTEDLGAAGDLLADEAVAGADAVGAWLRATPLEGWTVVCGWDRSWSGDVELDRIAAGLARSTSAGALALRFEHHPGSDGDRPYGSRVIAGVTLRLGRGEEDEDADADR